MKTNDNDTCKHNNDSGDGKLEAISLKETMNLIASNPAMVQEVRVEMEMQTSLPKRERMHGHNFDISSVSEYLGTDPVLLDLLKEYLDARANYNFIILSQGKSPMSQVAADTLDGAYIALQTRVKELKGDSLIARKIRKIKNFILGGSSVAAREELNQKRTTEANDDPLFNPSLRPRKRKRNGFDLILFMMWWEAFGKDIFRSPRFPGLGRD